MARQLCETTSRAGISATGFFYSDMPPGQGNPSMRSHLVRQIQGGYVSNTENFNMSTGMDQMIGFSKNLQQQSTDGNTAMWKSFNGETGSQPAASASRLMPEITASYYDQFTTAGISEAKIVGPHDPAISIWQENRLLVDDSSITYAFPCEGNERPSQGGLSLSLSSSNPTSFELQSFGIRHGADHHHQNQQDVVSSSSTDHQGLYGKSGHTQQQQDWFTAKAPANIHHGHLFLKNSKYLVPAQELLSEFCSLGTKLQSEQRKQKIHKNKQLEDEYGSVSSRKQSLNSLEFVELQRRKSKLLAMLGEVDRRYKHYCNQMKAVVSSFEVVAGNGAAQVYCELASKAMSRHFRCLKDGIVNQMKATRKAMGEKEAIAPGTTRGETPRLRVIDQTLRQQRAFQQMSMMESHPWRPQRGLPERAVSLLRAWLFEHFLHPYPSDVDKHILARQTGLSRSQVSNWFINARVRLWKPMVEEMYLEETKEQEKHMASSDEFCTDDIDDNILHNHTRVLDDQKPTPEQLVHVDSECLSSVVINNKDHSNINSRISCNVLPPSHLQSQMERVRESSYGSIEMDFTAYVQQSAPVVSYATNNANQSFNGGGVSLTLGLHQRGGSGVSLAFAPLTQNSMFYPRLQMEECHPIQYSILEGETQNPPYRNLMGAQLLNDLAG